MVRPEGDLKILVSKDYCSRCRYRAKARGHAYCKECRSEYQKQWRAKRKGLPEGRDVRLRRLARQRAYAVEKRGRLLRPDLCERCQAAPTEEKHHGDYSRPLDVQWFCHECHVTVTREQREAERRRLENNLARRWRKLLGERTTHAAVDIDGGIG